MTKGTKVIEVKGYFANDGEFFTNEDDCKDHEIEQLKEKLFNVGFDLYFEKTECIDNMLYFAPKNQKDIEIFLEVNEYYGYPTDGITLKSPLSIYKYDYKKGEYIDIVHQCNKLINEINKIAPNTI